MRLKSLNWSRQGVLLARSLLLLVKLIDPGLKDLDMNAPHSAALAAAVEANVRWSVAQLAGLSGPKEAIRDGRIILAGAIYELETGRVRFLTQ